jgi:hypothetical protein
VWQFWSAEREVINHADRYWTEAIDRPGAFQIGYLKKLIESRPYLNRVPDQSIIQTGQGEKGEYSCAFKDDKGSYLMVYIPLGKFITINTSAIKSKQLNCWWFNPKTADVIPIGLLDNAGKIGFTTPTTGFENDWVLVADNPDYKYPLPKIK